MTAADGWLGLAGAKARIPSPLVCYTSAHETLLTAHLREQLFRDMQDPADVAYDPTIANIIQDFLAKDKKTSDAGKAAGSSGESQKGKQNDGGAQQPGVKAGTKRSERREGIAPGPDRSSQSYQKGNKSKEGEWGRSCNVGAPNPSHRMKIMTHHGLIP